MPVNAISCPYCNTLISVADLARTGTSGTCPLCGERLPVRLTETAITAALPPSVNGQMLDQPPLDIAVTYRPPANTVRSIVLGVMGLMAIISFLFAWSTVNFRRANDFRPLRRVPAAVRTTPPHELTALGYLPAETSLIVGVHAADLRRTACGRTFLERFRLAGFPISLADLEKWTGLPADDIDHAVLGLRADNRLIPPLILVVQTRQTYDLKKVRDTLKAHRSSEVGRRTFYHFTPATGAKLSLDAVLWSPSPTTLVVGLSKIDLEAVPDQPTPGAKHLPGPLQEILRQRLTRGAAAWLAGHSDQWTAQLPLLSLWLDKGGLALLAQVHTFGFWLQFDEGVQLQGAIHCPDPKAMQTLEQKWERLKVPQGDTLPREFEPILQEMAAAYHKEVQDDWLTLRAASKPQTVQQALQK